MIFKTILKGIVLVVILVLIVWVGITFYANACSNPKGHLDMPEANKAAYSVYIKNTSGLLLTNRYETIGTEVGSRIYTLHGFWEVRGSKFVYKKTDVILDEAVFGEINIRRRK